MAPPSCLQQSPLSHFQVHITEAIKLNKLLNLEYFSSIDSVAAVNWSGQEKDALDVRRVEKRKEVMERTLEIDVVKNGWANSFQDAAKMQESEVNAANDHGLCSTWGKNFVAKPLSGKKAWAEKMQLGE